MISFKSCRAMNVKFLLPPHEVHGTDQTHQAQVVIAMHVADEDVADPLEVDAAPTHAFLCAFTTIDQVQSARARSSN